MEFGTIFILLFIVVLIICALVDGISFISSICWLGIWLVYTIIHEPEPTALDVYNGRTELKVTYEIAGNDTLSVDSIVIFKSK